MLATLNKRKVQQLQLQLQIKRANTKVHVTIDDDLSKDLTSIFEENKSSLPPCSKDSFEYLFWEEQNKAKSKPNGAHTWHPMIIRWCLNLKLISTSAYERLRSSAILKLPSSRTLRDYTHWVEAKSGFQSEIDMLLRKEAKLESCDEYARYACLVLDEVKVKKGLVYNKELGHVIGFTRLNSISNHLKEYERTVLSDKPAQEIASHMLVFMVRYIT